MSPHSKQKPLPCSNGVMGNDPKTFFIGHSLGLRPPPESGVTTKWGAERPKSLPLSRSERGWLTSPTSCVVERQPRVLKITSTLPKDLGKEDNIKASLGRAPAATQCCARREAPKTWGPSPALTGRDRAGLGGNRWPGSRKLPKELEPWGRSCSGPQQWQRQAERRCRKWREADKRGAATLNRKTTQGEVKRSHSAVSDSLQPHGLYSPRNSPGQNTGVGSHLPNPGIEPGSPALQADSLPAELSGKPKQVENEPGKAWHNLLSYNTISKCKTLLVPDMQLHGFSIHGIFQARILQWVAIFFSRGSSQPRDRTPVSHIAGRHFTVRVTGEVPRKQNRDCHRQ